MSSDIVTNQLLEGLKDLYGREELSDRILHILEIDESCYLDDRLFSPPASIDASTARRNSNVAVIPNFNDTVMFSDQEGSEDESVPGADSSLTDSTVANLNVEFSKTQNDDDKLHNDNTLGSETVGETVEINKNNKNEHEIETPDETNQSLTKKRKKSNQKQTTTKKKVKKGKKCSFAIDDVLSSQEEVSSDGVEKSSSDTQSDLALDAVVVSYCEIRTEDKTDTATSSQNTSSQNTPVEDCVLPNETCYNSTPAQKPKFVEVIPICSMPIHSIVLTLNSAYFRNLLTSSGMRESHSNSITLKVNYGEGKFLKLLINAFYDQSVLNDLETFDLLRVLEVADRFSCDVFIKKCVELLKNAKIKNLSECNAMVDHVKKLETRIAILGEKYNDMKQCCVKFMTGLFCPLENKDSEFDDFQALSYQSLLLLLKSYQSITWRENSLLIYIANWLDYDESRQSSDIVESLLHEINYKCLSPEFMFDIITEGHELFNVWPNFKTWFIDVISYHAFSMKRKWYCRYGNNIGSHFDRNFSSSNIVPGWKVKLEKIAPLSFISTECSSVFQGYSVTPRLFLKESSNGQHNVSLQINNSAIAENNTLIHEFINLDFTMAVALLPGFETYDQDIFTNKYPKFITKHFREVNVQFNSRTDYCLFNLGTIEQSLLETSDCLYVAMAFKEVHERWPSFMDKILELDDHNIYLDKKILYGQKDIDFPPRYQKKPKNNTAKKAASAPMRTSRRGGRAPRHRMVLQQEDGE